MQILVVFLSPVHRVTRCTRPWSQRKRKRKKKPEFPPSYLFCSLFPYIYLTNIFLNNYKLHIYIDRPIPTNQPTLLLFSLIYILIYWLGKKEKVYIYIYILAFPFFFSHFPFFSFLNFFHIWHCPGSGNIDLFFHSAKRCKKFITCVYTKIN